MGNLSPLNVLKRTSDVGSTSLLSCASLHSFVSLPSTIHEAPAQGNPLTRAALPAPFKLFRGTAGGRAGASVQPVDGPRRRSYFLQRACQISRSSKIAPENSWVVIQPRPAPGGSLTPGGARRSRPECAGSVSGTRQGASGPGRGGVAVSGPREGRYRPDMPPGYPDGSPIPRRGAGQRRGTAAVVRLSCARWGRAGGFRCTGGTRARPGPRTRRAFSVPSALLPCGERPLSRAGPGGDRDGNAPLRPDWGRVRGAGVH